MLAARVAFGHAFGPPCPVERSGAYVMPPTPPDRPVSSDTPDDDGSQTART
jgi:hypothetical protein